MFSFSFETARRRDDKGKHKPCWPRQSRPARVRPRLWLEPLEARDLLSGTWTPLVNPAPDRIATMMLLSDGTVMAHASEEGHMTADWYQLTPDAAGDYINGSWGQLSSMHDTRVYYASNVLPDGRVLVAGGEYGTGTRTAEVYDPVTDSWTLTPPRPLSDIGDVPSAMLPDGRVLLGYRFDGRTSIYDPVSNSWADGGRKDDSSGEESWMLLPDQTVLDAEVFGAPRAEKYIPAENTWVSAGTLPVNLVEGFEIGAGLLLPDGLAFFIGANGKTALYTVPPDLHDPGSWAAGPDLPDNHGAWDAPAAMMPNGKVLVAAGPRNYNGPTTFFEYDPASNAFTPVDSPAFIGPPYEGRMLMLPTGQVLWSYSNTELYVYTPDGGPDPAWKPTVADLTDNGDGTFLLTGTQLNGISEGAAYGDDAEMSSNYPIVQLTDGNGNVFDARTFNWSNTGVATGDTPVSTYFTLPAGIGPGDYSLSVVANGIASDPVPFTVGPTGPAAGQGVRGQLLPNPAALASGAVSEPSKGLGFSPPSVWITPDFDSRAVPPHGAGQEAPETRVPAHDWNQPVPSSATGKRNDLVTAPAPAADVLRELLAEAWSTGYER